MWLSQVLLGNLLISSDPFFFFSAQSGTFTPVLLLSCSLTGSSGEVPQVLQAYLKSCGCSWPIHL